MLFLTINISISINTIPLYLNSFGLNIYLTPLYVDIFYIEGNCNSRSKRYYIVSLTSTIAIPFYNFSSRIPGL